MGTLIKRPSLARVSPPFFEVHAGHAVKVIAADEPIWVRVLCVEQDELLGRVVSTEPGPPARELRANDVIEFKLCHVFGLY